MPRDTAPSLAIGQAKGKRREKMFQLEARETEHNRASSKDCRLLWLEPVCQEA